jgi:Rrf2 family nitric oxide-sensitive transcriptional repressor
MRVASAPEWVSTAEVIAAEFRISRHHLMKIVRMLAGAGIVVTQRGSGGGIRLAAATLGDIVRLLIARQALAECFHADCGACVLPPNAV